MEPPENVKIFFMDNDDRSSVEPMLRESLCDNFAAERFVQWPGQKIRMILTFESASSLAHMERQGNQIRYVEVSPLIQPRIK